MIRQRPSRRCKGRRVNPISLASGVVPEFGPLDTVRAAAAGGFDAVGLWVEPAQWTAETTREIRAALADEGLPVLDVEVAWLKPDAALGDHRRIIAIGADLGAAHMLCVYSHSDRSATVADLAALCPPAEASAMRNAMAFATFPKGKI